MVGQADIKIQIGFASPVAGVNHGQTQPVGKAGLVVHIAVGPAFALGVPFPDEYLAGEVCHYDPGLANTRHYPVVQLVGIVRVLIHPVWRVAGLCNALDKAFLIRRIQRLVEPHGHKHLLIGAALP